MTSKVTDERGEALAQLIEHLSVHTPGEPVQRSYRAYVIWLAERISQGENKDRSILVIRTFLPNTGLDVEQIEAAIALLYG